MTDNFIYPDFEFNQTKEEILNLVCASLNIKGLPYVEFWLHKDSKSKKELKEFILKNKDAIFVSWSVVAEARSFYSLGLNPMDFKWIDLYIEYRCISNHNDEINYGHQYVDGKVKFTKKPKPKWERTEEDTATSFKQTYSLAEASFKLLKVERDTEHKTAMRDLIISSPEEFQEEDKAAIQEYCTEDVVYLPQLHEAILTHYRRLLGSDFDLNVLTGEMLFRGSYAALTAIRESKGYPVDYPAMKNFSEHVKNVIDDTQREINKLFPDVKPFKWNKKESRFSWNQLATKNWLEKNVDTKMWKKTDGGGLSLALDAFERVFDFKHSYPEDNFGAQMVRFLKLKQNVYGFVPGKGSKDIWESVGSDGRVRPWMNIFGAQSGRSQPQATSFIFLKPAWMRVLVQPKKGKAMGGIDYGSEEFWIQALDVLEKTGDTTMVDAYLSGDVYLALAKLVGMVPKDGKKEDYKFERNLCKSTELGLSYLMTKWGLARKLTQDMGKPFTEEEAQVLVDKRNEAYPGLVEYQKSILSDYEDNRYLKLVDGWTMWGDNDNFRSVTNVPSQGKGSSIMRYADLRAYYFGLYVPFTLHDALYVEFDSDDLSAMDKLKEAMLEGFADAFPPHLREMARKIRLDPFVWSPDYEEDSELTTPEGWIIPASNKYIDERAQEEYDKFSRYFEPSREQDL